MRFFVRGNRSILFFVVGLLGLEQMASAVTSQLLTHLQSAAVVSPAQLDQKQRSKSYISFEAESISTLQDQANSGDMLSSDRFATGVFVAGIYSVEAYRIQTGIVAQYTGASSENHFRQDAVDTDYLVSETLVKVSPQATYSMKQFVVGAAVDIQTSSTRVESNEKLRADYLTFRPGALYSNNLFELGVAYASPNHLLENVEFGEQAVISPARLTAHGRTVIQKNLVIGGIVESSMWSGIDDFQYIDQFRIKGIAEYRRGRLQYEAAVGFNSSFYRDKSQVNLSSVATTTWGIAADYILRPGIGVGVCMNLELGNDEGSAGTIFEKNVYAGAFRSLIRF